MQTAVEIKKLLLQHKIILALLICAAVAAIALATLSFIPAYSATPLPVMGLSEDERFMALAFAEIGKSTSADGYPVGAVVVRDGKIIGRSSNRLFETNNPTQHAETRAIAEAIGNIQKQRPREKYSDFFKDSTIYVTLEPCPMDAGKITMLQFKRVVYCDTDEEWGDEGTVDSNQGFPSQTTADQSTLPLCRELRDRPGWNFPELWQIGKSYAVSTGQAPSILSVWFQKIKGKLNQILSRS